MDFNLTPEEEAFRDEVRQFLDENLLPSKDRPPNFMAEWLRKVRERPDSTKKRFGSSQRKRIFA